MNTIVPAILAQTPESFQAMLQALAPCGIPLHIDLADGRFVPNRTITLSELRANEPSGYTLHLMFDCPEHVLRDIPTLKAERVIIHAEATNNLRAVAEAIHKLGKKVGVAVNPETPISVATGLVHVVDSVLFMSVTPGFQGGAFIPAVRDKVRAFRNQFPHVRTGIDGGMNATTIPHISTLGLDVIVVGSAIVEAVNPEHAYHTLQELAHAHQKMTHEKIGAPT